MGKSSWSKYKLAPSYSNHTAVITRVSRTGVRRRDHDDAAETAWTWQIPTLDLTIHLQVFPTQGQGDQISQQAAVSFLILYLEPALQSPLRPSAAVRPTDSSTESTGTGQRESGQRLENNSALCLADGS
jgi:hypothetical protein